MTTRNIFDTIYASSSWGDHETKSGPGSTTKYTTNIRQELLSFVSKFSVKTLFDAPCGDFIWMRQVGFPENMTYIGGDGSSIIIENNGREFTSVGRTFMNFDIAHDPFPAVDAWFCRDCMFHLSYRDIYSALQNFVDSKVPLVFMTTHLTSTTAFRNTDIATGGFRILDLYLPPFELPRDILFWAADYVHPHPRREMSVWTREQISAALPTMAG